MKNISRLMAIVILTLSYKQLFSAHSLNNNEFVPQTSQSKLEELVPNPEKLPKKSIKITELWGSKNLLRPALLTDRILRKQLNKLMLEENNVPGLFGETKKELREEQPSLPIFLNQFYGPRENLLVLHKNNKPIGVLFFALLQQPKKIIVYVTLLAIKTTEQRKGYGRRLLNHLRTLYPDNKIQLSVYRKNKEAMKFYKKLNFTTKKHDSSCPTLEQAPTHSKNI